MKEVRAEQHTMNQKYYHSDIKLILVDSFGFGFVSLKNLWFVWSFFEWLHLFLVVVSDFVVYPYFGELIFTAFNRKDGQKVQELGPDSDDPTYPLRKPILNIS